MKIAIICQSYPPMVSGAAIFTERLAKYFAAGSHEVLVLAASDRPRPYQVRKGSLLVKRVTSYPNPLRVEQRFALWPHWQVVRSLSDFAPDLIHLHDPLQMAVSSLSYARRKNVPVLMTVHALPWLVTASLPLGKGFSKLADFVLWHYARWLLKRCTASVMATKTMAEVLCAHTGISPQVISCGVDLDTFQPGPLHPAIETAQRARLGIPAQAPVILYVGRVDKDKQVEKIIQAAVLAMRKSAAHLLVVGDGTERQRLEGLCENLRIAERCHFTGFVSVAHGLVSLYQLADVFVTAGEIETQGMVLLEAAACGLPIVAVRATCLHELVHEECNGYLLPIGDIPGMAQRLCELIHDPSRAHEMGLVGRQIVESHAAEDTFAAYEALYRATIQRKSDLAAVSRKVLRRVLNPFQKSNRLS